MIFITKDNIYEVSDWCLQGNEIISDSSRFHEILKSLSPIKAEFENQIKEHPAYINLIKLQI